MAIAVGDAIRIGNKAPAFESLAESAAGHAQELDHYLCGDLASGPRNAGICFTHEVTAVRRHGAWRRR